MKYRNLLYIILLLFITACDIKIENDINKLKSISELKYKNSGFALVYNEGLNIKKLDDRSLQIFHKNLKKKSFIKITNPVNGKSVIAEVKSNRINFSPFYNSIISKRISETLELDLNEPYINIKLINKDSTFIAGKSKTFEEEKEVAEKAPIDGIKISNLNKDTKNNKKQLLNNKFSYSIKVADFYYKKTAELMINRIKTETKLENLKIIELSKTNYRVLLGPFNDINSLKESFEKMNSLYFENLEILKNA
tara:strand:- start:1176 stop:1928 length:753 start_codon:yes stop_codon:yes gene_type:complete